MRPLVIGSHVWRVVRVMPGDPLLMDRTGRMVIATTDPVTKTIRIGMDVMPPLFDQVYLHEAAHAMMVEVGVPDYLSGVVGWGEQVLAEELVAWFLESHAIQVIDAVSASLGRPVCVDGRCMGGTS